ncbi:LysR family transcriptional regulator [Serratia aquatilis]|uniref:LysR family transcriptional regulator n=1 Tax=Serratia aquatilis TaxID=1737515 RepID=A0ABV6E7H1_9GAMM
MIKLKPLSYFKAVVEHGSVSAAAEVLYIAQPPLSKALSQLEEEWGVRLFERSSRGMAPTEAGHYLYQCACALLQMAAEVEEEMHAFGEGQRGVVRIGTVSMGIPRVAQMMQAIRQRRPELSFSLYQGDTGHLEELLEKQRIDLALVHLPLTSSEVPIVMTPLAHASFRALCHPGSPLAQHSTLSLKQLIPYPLTLLRRKSGFGVYEQVLQSFAKQGLQPQVFADASDIPMMCYLAQQDMAIALLPVLPKDRVWEGLVAIPVPELDAVADDLVMLYRTQQENRPALRAVVEYLKQPNDVSAQE